MILCLQYIREFGFFKGSLLYKGLKFKTLRKIRLPGLKHPFGLRHGTIDKYTFEEIFVHKDYGVEIPMKLSTKPFIVDGGANIGFAALYFLRHHKNAEIICIEPDAENFGLLENNTRGYGNIKCFRGALWNKNTNINVYDEGFGTRGYVVRETDQVQALGAITIDEIMRKNSREEIDILKMDIEGSEKELFRFGYENWLPKTKCLIIELHDHINPGCSKAFFKAISQYNFSTTIKGENIFCFNKAYMYTET